MRTLSASALTEIATKLGTEPVVILEVDWVEGAPSSLYADRTIDTIPGAILEVGNLDNVINITDGDGAQEITITLDDTNGSIKAILDSHDIHKRTARVYQWFEGLDLTDRFMLFSGKISSPITWDERDRSVSFTIISQIEDKEIGFSAEEGDFPWIPKDLIGKAWPLIFGKVQDVPALQFNKAVTGTTLCSIGTVIGADYHTQMPLGGNDASWGVNLAMQSWQAATLECARYAFTNAANAAWLNPDLAAEYRARADECWDRKQQIWSNISRAWAQRSYQEACSQNQRQATLDRASEAGCNPVRILGGEDFPQHKLLSLQIGGAIVSGSFDGDKFTISSIRHFEKEEKAEERYNNALAQQCETSGDIQEYDFSIDIPCGYGNTWDPCRCRNFGFVIPSQPNKSRPNQDHVAEQLWIDAGARATIYGDEEITYVVSIIPGTVLAVKAYKTFEGGEQRLVNVPTSLWRVETKNYGPITAVQVVLSRPLSAIEGQGWSDDLYVTFESNVGPNTVDILEHIITNYTNLSFDTTSFNAVKSKLNSFPMNFPILDRKNTIEVLQEIAFQARCALWISNGVFYIKYLPEEPTSDSTITVSDIDAETGVVVELTPTEDLVTKMVVSWRISWAEDPNKLILRHNVKKYGTQQREFDFYCFNQPGIVLKVATFWLIRLSNTWKKVRFTTFLQKLNLETFDTVTLDFGSQAYVATSSIKTIVEQANYNSASQTIDFIVRTPVKAGTMEAYKFFWPSQVSADWKFPTDEEQAAGLAGGDGIGQNATGQLPIGFTDLSDWGSGVVWVGGPNVLFRGHADWGDRSPSDLNFTPQNVILTSTYAELVVAEPPDPDLTLNFVDPIEPPELLPLPSGKPFRIDLHETIIVDSQNNDVGAPLATFFKKVNEDQQLVVDGDNAKFGNSEQPDGKEFDFRYDDDGGKMGTGTAFLKGA